MSPWAGGAIQVRDDAHVVVTDTVFFNNTSWKTDTAHEEGSGGAISIHGNLSGEWKVILSHCDWYSVVTGVALCHHFMGRLCGTM